jgi:glutathione peroxidase-family protein
MASFYDFEMQSIAGESADLAGFEEQVCLVVNVASE